MKKSADEFVILKAAVGDAKLIAALGATTFYETYFELDKPSDLADYIAANFNPEIIRTELTDPETIFFIAYLNTKAIGYAKLRKNSKIPGLVEKNVAELQRIYILQKMTGRGFGKILLRRCLEEATGKGFETIWLSVWENNLNAQKFYEKQGFVRVGQTEYPYGSEIAINFVMKKDL